MRCAFLPCTLEKTGTHHDYWWNSGRRFQGRQKTWGAFHKKTLAFVIFFDNIALSQWDTAALKYSEFCRYLKSLGATFAPAKGSHFKVTLNGRFSYFPDHGAKEMKTGLAQSIKNDLGLK